MVLEPDRLVTASFQAWAGAFTAWARTAERMWSVVQEGAKAEAELDLTNRCDVTVAAQANATTLRLSPLINDWKEELAPHLVGLVPAAVPAGTPAIVHVVAVPTSDTPPGIYHGQLLDAAGAPVVDEKGLPVAVHLSISPPGYHPTEPTT